MKGTRWQRVVLGGSIVVAAVASLPASTLAASPAENIVIVPAAVRYSGPFADDVRFRQTFGLRSDISYIRQVRSAAAPAPGARSMPWYGVALTPSENAEITFRATKLEAAEKDPAVRTYLARQSSFAGEYIDQAGGGRITLRFTSDVAHRTQELRELVPYHDRLVVAGARYTLAYLKELQANDTSKMTALRDAGLNIYTVGADPISNAVVVGMAQPDVHAQQVFASIFGDVPIHLQPSDRVYERAVDGLDAPPFRGGQLQLAADQTGLFGCTSAFIAAQPTGIAAQPYLYYVLTAGHCTALHGQYSQYTFYEGTNIANTWNVGGTSLADGAAITIAGFQSNQVAEQSGVYDAIRVVQCNTCDNVNDFVCVSRLNYSGNETPFGCGALVSTNQTINVYDDKGVFQSTLLHAREANVTTQPGDSGGPWYRPSTYTAMGITSAGNSSYTFYSHISDVVQQLHLSGLYVQTCCS